MERQGKLILSSVGVAIALVILGTDVALVMKLTQYDDIVAPSFVSTSSQVWFGCPVGLLKA